jgi:mono/diheme cytochrome c family protein
MFKKILIGILAVAIILVLSFVVFVYTSYDTDYSDQYPVPDLNVKADSALIERGRYLVHGPAHCVDCHAPVEKVRENEGKEELALTGGFGLKIPPGEFYGPNLTPDVETGIGRYSDGQLYRMLRHNIRADGRAALDFMPFINMADEDIYAIIAYLRAQKAVKNQMPETEYTFLGKMFKALGAVKPGEPIQPVLKSVKEDTTAEYGKYLANSVANCYGCHTERDLKSGAFIGQAFAGGMVFGPDSFTKGWVYISPNITPDKDTGLMTDWDEDSFIDRMNAGRIYDTSPMAWEAFHRVTDNDWRAIFRYLKTVKPVQNEIANIAAPPVEN